MRFSSVELQKVATTQIDYLREHTSYGRHIDGLRQVMSAAVFRAESLQFTEGEIPLLAVVPLSIFGPAVQMQTVYRSGMGGNSYIKQGDVTDRYLVSVEPYFAIKVRTGFELVANDSGQAQSGVMAIAKCQGYPLTCAENIALATQYHYLFTAQPNWLGTGAIGSMVRGREDCFPVIGLTHYDAPLMEEKRLDQVLPGISFPSCWARVGRSEQLEFNLEG